MADNLRILITNDDGINATGLKVLETIARTISDDVWIVAPEHDQSAVSHSLTLRMPFRINEISQKKYSVSTPCDLGLHLHLMFRDFAICFVRHQTLISNELLILYWI